MIVAVVTVLRLLPSWSRRACWATNFYLSPLVWRRGDFGCISPVCRVSSHTGRIGFAMPPPPSHRPSPHTSPSQSGSYRWFVLYFVSVACVWLAGVLLLASLSSGSARTRFADRFLQSKAVQTHNTNTDTDAALQTGTRTSRAVLDNPCRGVHDDDVLAGHKDMRTGNHVYFHVLPPWLSCMLNSSLLASPPPIGSLPSPLDFPIDDSATLSECQRVDFGAELLRRWQSASSTICDGDSSSGSSVVYEHRIRQARHSGDDYYLELHHAILDSADGRLHLNCKAGSQLTQPGTYREHQGLHDVAQLMTFDDRGKSAAKDGPVYTLFVRRDCDGAGNLYHCSADLINAFMLLHSIQLAHRTTTNAPQLPAPTHDNTLILFTDSNPSLTKFSLLWKALSPTAKPFAAYRAALSSPLSLPRVYGALQSGANMIWKDFWFNDPCGAVAPILDAFSRFATFIYLPQPLPTWLAPEESNGSESSNAVRVLVASRRNAKYRRASNEEALARHLAAMLPLGSSIVLLDLGTLTFEQQVAAVNSVDLLVGMHGAALNLLLFVLPERRRVELKQRRLHLMELFNHEKDRPKTYANMAVRLGIGYGSWVGTNEAKEIEVDVLAIGQTVKEMYKLR